MKQSFALVIAGSAVVVASCGSSGSDRADVVDTLPESEALDELTESADVPTESVDDVADAPDAVGVAALTAALDSAASATSYRSELAMGLDMEMGALGQSISFPADLDTAMVFVEVDAEGEQYTRVDLAPMMTAVFDSTGMDVDATELLGGDLSMETWMSGSTLTMDMGGFGAILAQTPGADVFPADTFTIDTSRLADGVGGPEVASALAGQAAPDPVELAAVLSEVLASSGSVEVSGGEFTGTISFLEYARAFGQDPDAMLGGMDTTFDQIGGADVAEAMFELFEQIETDVAVTIVDDAVDTVRFDIDMSVLFAELPTLVADSGEVQGDAAQFDAFADSTFTMTMLMDYDLDPTVDVIVPQGDFVDATDAFLSLYNEALGAN